MNEDQANPGGSAGNATRLEWLVLAACVASSAVTVVWVLAHCWTGFDFSDEGSYLQWISHPWLYKASVTEYGFIYHPLYLLTRGDVGSLRAASILITLFLGFLLSYRLLASFSEAGGMRRGGQRVQVAAVAFILATGIFSYLQLWLPTPSYNSLAVQSFLLCAIAILHAGRERSLRGAAAWAMIGASWSLAFLAKPPASALLVIVTTFFLFGSARFSLRLFGVSVATFLLCLSSFALCVDGSIAAFAERLRRGLAISHVLQSGHTLSHIVRWDDFSRSREETAFAWAASLGAAAVVLVASSSRAVPRICASAIALLLGLACVSMVAGIARLPLGFGAFRDVQFLSVSLGVALAGGVLWLRQRPRTLSFARAALALTLLVLPHAYAFGTNRNYWQSASEVSLFWVLAGIVVLAPNPRERLWFALLPLAVGSQVLTVAFLSSYMAQPYRQPEPLDQMREAVTVGAAHSTLWVSREVASYVRGLQGAAKAGGLAPDTPMIDLTGRYPGALFLLGCRSLGLPWMIGAYKGSDALASQFLRSVPPAELRSAWVLTEPGGPREISGGILGEFNLELGRDYVEVGSVDSPRGEYPEIHRQHLFRPRERAAPATPAR
jgi:hypothetical protein